MNLQVCLAARASMTPVVAAVAAAIAIIGCDTAFAADHYYRDSVDTRTEPPAKYVIEVPEAAAMHGGYFKVTTDDSGRITRVIFLVDGKPVSDTNYIYANGAKLPSETRSYKQGALTSVSKFTRDAAGQVTRSDYYTAQGVLTGYTVTKYAGGQAESANFTPKGTRRWRTVDYFNADGLEIKSTTYAEGATSFQESVYDPARGLETSSKQFNNGKLQTSYTNTYDDDDDLVRQDLYDPAGKWYGAKIYEQNLLVKKLYKFSDGHAQETQIKYDAKRWTESAQMFRDGKLICKFTYEHLPDGTTKRTIALGPDGSLWAEYANRYVNEVDQHGHPPNTNIGTIHKTGNWW